MLTGTFLEMLTCLEDLACIWGTVSSLFVHEDEGVLHLQTSNTEERGTHLQEPGTDKTKQHNFASVTHLLKDSVTK